MKPVVLIKIGGSLITDKSKPFTLDENSLDLIVTEIGRAKKESEKLLILGHGGGSFPHVPAQKYQTHLGVINQESYQGIAEVQEAAARLNRIVVKRLVNAGLPAVSISPSGCYLTCGGRVVKIFTDSIEKLLQFEMLPVLYGDVVMDQEKGCCILSTESVLGSLALALKNKGFLIEKIIHCGKTEGVYDKEGKTIPFINRENFVYYRDVLGGSSGIDVTGGMFHKVEESLKLAEQGIPALIIDGVTHGTLLKAINNGITGTKIL